MEDCTDSERVSEAFLCSICLDLLYKPVVLACGHVSCFWCVHKSMHSRHESHCPLCRNPYRHFPAICQMLHFLLLKIYPVTYKKRENQILDDEKQEGLFSPALLVANEELNPYLTRNVETCPKAKLLENSLFKDSYNLCHPNEIHVGSFEKSRPHPVEQELSQSSSKRTGDDVSNADVLCSSCAQLLYRPVVLNCGHVYCEACVIVPMEGTLACQVCQSLHPVRVPKVCLELDHFLEGRFSSEYYARKPAAQVHSKNAIAAASKQGIPFSYPPEDKFFEWVANHGSNFHPGVGCDYCGMYPIIGSRHRCKDCTEKIGFDLCGECYNSRSNLPGRFNQQHTPAHQFEIVKTSNMRDIMFSLFRGRFGYVSSFTTPSNEDPVENPDTAFPSNGDALENHSNSQSPI